MCSIIYRRNRIPTPRMKMKERDVGDEDMIIIGDDVITCVRRGEGEEEDSAGHH